MEFDSDPDDPVDPSINSGSTKKTMDTPLQPQSCNKQKKITNFMTLRDTSPPEQSDNTIAVNDELLTYLSNNTDKNNGTNSNNVEKISESDLQKVLGNQSIVRNFFTKVSASESKCNMCGKTRATPCGTTTTLMKHLEKHPASLKEFKRLKEIQEKIKQETKEKVKVKKQVSLKESFCFVLPLDPKSDKAKAITKAIAVCICKGLHPYSLVEEPAFIALLHLLEPRYDVPCRTTFSRSVIPKLYEEIKTKKHKELDVELDTLESVSITTDLWSSRSGEPFIGFTIQYLTALFEMKNMTIDCKSFPGKHTAAAIFKQVVNALTEWNLSSENIDKYIVSDSGANIKKALEGGGSADLNVNEEEEQETDRFMTNCQENCGENRWRHVSCFNHKMQLAVNDTCNETGAKPLVDKISGMIGRYSKSRPAWEKFKKLQVDHHLSNHELIAASKTRWDSEYLMMRRFLEQKAAIVSEHSYSNIECLTSNEWKLAEGYVEVLKSVANFTADMGSSIQPTLSMVIPVLFEIKANLQEFISNKSNRGHGIMFARSLLANIKQRFPDEDFLHSELYRTAMLLDPRFKQVLLNQDQANQSALLLEGKAKEKYRNHIKRGLVQPNPSRNIATGASKSAEKQSKWSHLQKLSSNNESSQDEEETIKKEVEIYLSIPVIKDDEDPLNWWKLCKENSPVLAPLARHYLGLAATETPSERVFSVGGNTVTPKRTNLLPEHVREIIFCHDNIP